MIVIVENLVENPDSSVENLWKTQSPCGKVFQGQKVFHSPHKISTGFPQDIHKISTEFSTT